MNLHRLVLDLEELQGKAVATGNIKIINDDGVNVAKEVTDVQILHGKAKIKKIKECLLNQEYYSENPGLYHFEAIFSWEPADHFEDEIISTGHCNLDNIDLRSI